MGLDGSKSLNQKVSEALIIPLAAWLHTGREGIDGQMGRETWELARGTQASYIDRVSELVGYDLWELHRLWLSHKYAENEELKRRWLGGAGRFLI
jgi:hypothetical protein